MDEELVKRLSNVALKVTDAMARDKTCKNCKHLASKQLSAIMLIGGGFSTNDCGNCKNGSNFKARD